MTKYAKFKNGAIASIESPDKTKQKLGATMFNDDTPPKLANGESPIISDHNKRYVESFKQDGIETGKN